jgi:tetratricopeptide (TPR) repeat protein
MADTTNVDVRDKDTDEVVAEVKARLFRSKIPWLIVFDNLEDRNLLDKFLPNGGCGHVLVTTRHVDHSESHFHSEEETMMLGCFSPSESVELLRRSAGTQNMGKNCHIEAAHKLADQLGHLPLALGVAAAYMRRCDVDCSEYLARYEKSERSGHILGHEAVSASLTLSLNAIHKENPIAWEVLRLLAFLGPDQITKSLLRSLLTAKNVHTQAEAQMHARQVSEKSSERNHVFELTTVGGSLALCSIAFLHSGRTVGRGRLIGTVTIIVLSIMAVTAYSVTSKLQQDDIDRVRPLSLPRSTSFTADVFEQTDQIWKILKSFSLLDVKEGKGSMHRLLAQALRLSQDERDSWRNLEICIRAVQRVWSFRVDSDTWQNSSVFLEHVKAVVSHAAEKKGLLPLDTSILSREAGVFSAMALNRFEEAQFSLEQSLNILDMTTSMKLEYEHARATSLHELGRVYRYQGKEANSEEALQRALVIWKHLAKTDHPNAQRGVAATLHELGVLEVKKHSLDSAANFLQEALDLRRSLQRTPGMDDVESECTSTLHQLAAVQVARKPPMLDEAEGLLQQALSLKMQIGQRAATLKQLARVAIRRGDFDEAEKCLEQALELYVELFGENTLHINIASVRFQQGALAFQREQLEEAW